MTSWDETRTFPSCRALLRQGRRPLFTSDWINSSMAYRAATAAQLVWDQRSLASIMSNEIFRFCGRVLMGPSGVVAQLWARMRSAISLVPGGHEVGFRVVFMAQVHPADATRLGQAVHCGPICGSLRRLSTTLRGKPCGQGRTQLLGPRRGRLRGAGA
jgi:hypothetical protein